MIVVELGVFMFVEIVKVVVDWFIVVSVRLLLMSLTLFVVYC